MLFVLILSAGWLFVSSHSAWASFSSFITRSGDKFMDGGTEFRFVGTNVPFLLRSWADPAEIEDTMKAAAASGINVIRAYPFEVRMSADPQGTFRHVMGPGNFNESAFKLADKAIQLANQYNIRLIIPFVDNYNYVGGYADWAAFRGKSASEFWTDATLKQDFKNFISYVLNRTNSYTNILYKDDKAIMAWQLGNELLSTDSWTSEMAAYTKSIDPNHLVGDGGYVRAQGIRTNAVNDANIDFIDPHIYSYHQVDMAAKLSEWRNTTAGKKPLIIGEFGDYSAAETEQLLGIVQSNGTSGAMYWGTMPHHKLGGWHWPPLNGWVYLRYPGFASGDWAEETAIVGKLRQYAYAMQGQSPPAWPAPAAPVMLPADSVHNLSWRGSAGAREYEIGRAQSASGPWTVIAANATDDVSVPRFYNDTVPLFDDTTAVPGTSYYYRVRAKSADGVASVYSNVIGPIMARDVIVVDNGGINYTETGTWGSSTLPGSYNGGSRYSSLAGSTARWQPNVTAPGYYSIFVRYPYHATSALNARYKIYHNGVFDSVSGIDQTVLADGKWRLIDTVYFAGGPSEYIELQAVGGSSANYRADAVLVEPRLFGDSFQRDGGVAGWTAPSGVWSTATDGTTVFKQSGTTGEAEAYAGPSVADAAVSAAVKAYDLSGANASAGLIARASADLSSFYTMRINYDTNKLQLYKKVSGVWTKLGETDFQASPGTWYLLRLELKGASIKAFVNGSIKLNVSDTALSAGYSGLRTYGQTVVFDNFHISAN
ncbi:hypothetical protein VN24_20500 [Paenibacillus beijingensis]|uniref:mannan endo-1,4-beta-mannosidase n=2 Tax=Paenibacillus beijingensis TaxID=1126833 RepID=A0A0D5NRW0_9BACL|nr:hypothetical protein VN24_20500 [Paenibacillus beijingensis]